MASKIATRSHVFPLIHVTHTHFIENCKIIEKICLQHLLFQTEERCKTFPKYRQISTIFLFETNPNCCFPHIRL